MSKTEAREYLKAKGALKQRLIDLAYGRPYGSKPILVPLSKALKAVDETGKTFPKILHTVPINAVELLGEGKTRALTDSTDVVDGYEAAKWFKKWFGSATAQKPSKEKAAK